jgi:methionine-rich copper-binding protein CopC
MKARFLSLALLFAVSAGQAAVAHAFLKHAEPSVGSAVATLPSLLVMSFTEDLETAFCKVTVTGPAGASAGDGVQPVPGHADEIAIPLTNEGLGTYKVTWHAVSVDTHHTQGSFTFTVTGG